MQSYAGPPAGYRRQSRNCGKRPVACSLNLLSTVRRGPTWDLIPSQNEAIELQCLCPAVAVVMTLPGSPPLPRRRAIRPVLPAKGGPHLVDQPALEHGEGG
jgi:hypothetical protein